MEADNHTERPFFPKYLGFDVSDSEDSETQEDRTRKCIESSRSEETVRKIDHWVKRRTEYCQKQNYKTLETLNKTELNTLYYARFLLT